MLATINYHNTPYQINLNQPIPIALPFGNNSSNTSAWYCPPVSIEPVRMGDWIGDVKQGGSVNFRNIHFNPHGNGTHTESVGHISKEEYSIYTHLKQYFFLAQVITITPQNHLDNDLLITKQALINAQLNPQIQAIIIRTLPNEANKQTTAYTQTNPPYIEDDAMHYLVQLGIEHLLIDLPSVDKEQDNGKLSTHHIFWNYPQQPRTHCTITELIYVPNHIPDALYFLQLSIAPFHNDATPSTPILYSII